MRVLVHAAGLSRGGGYRHLEGLIPALSAALPADGGATFVVRETVAAALQSVAGRVELVAIPDAAAPSAMARLVLDNAAIPVIARLRRADVVVSLGNFGPAWAGAPHVVFQTNATFFTSTPDASPLARARLAMRRALAIQTLRSADRVVTPSAAMRDLVRAAVPRVDVPFDVLPHAIEQARFPFVARPAARVPFVFFCPNVAAPYKGLDVVVEALPHLMDDDVEVRAHGDTADWPEGMNAARARAHALGANARFVLDEELDGGAMPGAYERADALLYSTRCESFGFQLLEALSMGLPIVASDIPVNREIAGDAAVYYPVDAPRELAETALRVARDPALRRDLVARTRHRMTAHDWSWSRYARDFWAICERAR